MINNELTRQESDINTQAHKYIELFNQSNGWITDSHVNRVKNMLIQVLEHKEGEKLELLAYNNKNIFKVVLELFKRITTNKVSEIIGDFEDMNSIISGNNNQYQIAGNNIDTINSEGINKINQSFIKPLSERLTQIRTNITEYRNKLKIYFDYTTFISKFTRGFSNITRLTEDLINNETVTKSYLESNIKRIEENEVNIINAAKSPFQYYLSFLNKKIKEIFSDKINLGSAKINNVIIELNNTSIYNYLFSNAIQTSKDLLNFEKWLLKIREILNNKTELSNESIIVLDKDFNQQVNN